MSINYSQARATMVEQQVRPWDVLDPRVLEVLSTLPRDAFVPAQHRALAYADLELPLGHGEVMMKPVVEGRMLQSLEISPTDEVLEIGTGSGFITACLARLAREVVSLERHPELADAARKRLAELRLDGNVHIETADALAWQSPRQFDVVCTTGAVDQLPARFAEWLRPGGRLFVIRGRSPVMEAVLLRNEDAGIRIESLFETDLPYLAGAAPAPQFVF